MKSLSLAWASITSRPLTSWLCITAAAAGITLLCAVLLFTSALEGGLKRNADGIDIVVGAKGSPLQMIMATVYHVDIPAGNMEAEDAAAILKNPDIKKSIPIAMGDSYKGFRILGSTQDYVDLYGAEIADGKMFDKPFEAVAGSLTGLKIGTEFAAMHGLASEDGHKHEDHHYTVTGILKPTGTVIDRLIVTPLKSVQEAHEHHHHDDDDDDDHDHHDAHEEEHEHEEHGITALFLQMRTPVAKMNLPREINESTNVMAASPGYVMTRFSKDMGLGRDALMIIGFTFIGLSVFVLLAMLTAGLSARKYDLAVLRVLGASPLMLASTVMLEGILLSVCGTAIGLIAGHALAYTAVMLFPAWQSMILPATLLMPTLLDGALLLCGILCGILGGVVPTIMAVRADIAGLLAKGR